MEVTVVIQSWVEFKKIKIIILIFMIMKIMILNPIMIYFPIAASVPLLINYLSTLFVLNSKNLALLVHPCTQLLGSDYYLEYIPSDILTVLYPDFATVIKL